MINKIIKLHSQNSVKAQIENTIHLFVNWVSSKREPLHTRIARSDDERQKLIALRTNIYTSEHKHSDESQMIDCYDPNSILIGVWKGDIPIASARAVALGENDEWEHDKFMTWGKDMPNKSETIEISRLCISLQHRNWHVFKALSEGIAMAVVQSERRYMCASCTISLKLFYKKYGAIFTGDGFARSDLAGKKHYMFYSDIHLTLVGKGIETLPWISLYPKIAFHELIRKNILPEISLPSRLYLVAKCGLFILPQTILSYLIVNLKKGALTR